MLEREPRKIKMKNSLLSLVLPRVVRRVDCPASRRIRFACRAVQALFFSRGGTMGKLSVRSSKELYNDNNKTERFATVCLSLFEIIRL